MLMMNVSKKETRGDVASDVARTGEEARDLAPLL